MKSINGTEFVSLIKQISERLNPDENLINTEYITRFQNRYQMVSAGIEEVLSIGRNMKIGIVGEVKAGKSSFLNALIFNGESVLPQAATPMTAALTKITYSKDNSAKIVFYSDYDWTQIESLSSKYDLEFERLYNEYRLNKQQCIQDYSANGDMIGESTFFNKHTQKNTILEDISDSEKRLIENKISPEYRACKELTVMAIARQIDIGSLLNKTQTLDLIDVKAEMEKYVGANGEFTPLVKHIELCLDNEMLKGFEIIDTPGLNDPILSRSDTTKKFLMNCDLIFLLSYSGQFLSNEDINFITKTLPSESIQHAVIIGSKFDSAILDYPVKRGQRITFKEALQGTKKTLDAQAQSSLEECKKTNEFKNVGVIDKLLESMPPYYISSILFSAAKKISSNSQFSELEEHVINNLKTRFDNFEIEPDFLLMVSNIERVKSKTFDMIYKDKEQIIEEKSRGFIRTERSNLLSMLEDINIQALKNLNDIKVYDKEKLETKIEMLNSKMNAMRGQIKTIFELCAVDSQKYIKDISVDVKCIVKNHTDIQTGSEQQVRHGSYQEGWWIFKQTKHYTETVNVHTASVHDVIKNIREYIIEAERMINSDISRAINTNDIQKKVKDCVLKAFDLSDTSFNESDILDPLELVLSRLTIPKITIDVEKFNEMILKSFSSTYVEGNQIHDLMLKQEEVLQKVTKSICSDLDKMGKEIENTLIEKASTFVDDVNKHLEVNVNTLQNHLKNKEESIHKYQNFIVDIKSFKQQLQSFGGVQ